MLAPDKHLPRAWQLAEDLTRRPTLLLRYTRLLFTEYLRRQSLGFDLRILWLTAMKVLRREGVQH